MNRRTATISRTLAPVLAAALLHAAPAAAAPALRHQVDLHGDFAIIGNTLGHDCGAGTSHVVVGTVGACGSNTGDDAIDVLWQSDPGTAQTATASTGITAAGAGSTAVLSLPAGALIRSARLYWAGTLAASGSDTAVTLSRPGGTPVAVTADATFPVRAVGGGSAFYYQASADVTATVASLGTGAFRVAGVDVMPLTDLNSVYPMAAWTLVVFWELPSEPLRNLALFDGFDVVSSGVPAAATLSGFTVPAAGYRAKLGVLAYEGDATRSGDSLLFNGTALSDGVAGSTTNFFNGSRRWLGAGVSTPGDLPQLDGAAASQAGVDLDVVDVTALVAPGQTSASIQATSSNDLYVLGAFVTSISTLRPDFIETVKSLENLTRPAGVLAGDRLRYTVVATNTGSDASVDTVLTDPLPAGLTLDQASVRVDGAAAGALAGYDAPSRTLTVRIGTGATAATGGTVPVGGQVTVTFEVTLDAGVSGTLDNLATVTAAGLNGNPVTSYPSHPPGGGGPTVLVVDACVTDAQCGGATPACDTAPTPNACVGCLGDAHCGGATPFCDTAAQACVAATALLPASRARRTVAGVAAPFPVTLQSWLSLPERYRLDLTGACADATVTDAGGATIATRPAGGAWTVEPGFDADADGLPDVAVAAASSLDLVLWLAPPAGALPGETCPATLAATGLAFGLGASAAATVTADLAATFTPDHVGAAARVVPSGGLVRFPGTVRNNGAAPLAFDLGASLSATPAAGPLAAVAFLSDPDGDGDPSDGAPIVATDPVGPFGGELHVVMELRAATAAGDPVPAGSVIEAVATATAGAVSAAQLATAQVGWIASYADAASTLATAAFAPCDTVHVKAARLPAADAFALEWYGSASPVRGTDAPLRVVDPWPVTAGAASDALALAADAPGALAVVLVQRLAGLETVLETLPVSVERAGAVAAFAVPARVGMGDPLPLSAQLRSDAAAAGYGATRLAWAVSGAGLAMDGTGAFVAPPATARLASGLDVAAGATATDAFTATPAWPAPGRYQVEASWQLSCAATPPIAAAVAEVEVAPPPPALDTPAAGAAVATGTPTVGGVALPGATVVVSLDGLALPPALAAADGRFAVVVPAGSPLADGPHAATATQALGGAVSDASTPLGFAVDTAPPAVAVTGPADGLLLGAAAAPGGAVAVAGTLEPGATLQLTVDGTAVAASVAGGAFTATATLLDGHHLVEARATDAAGNAAVASAAFDLDTTPPAPPVVSAPLEGALLGEALAAGGLVAVSGTAEDGATVRLSAGAAQASALAAGGAWQAVLALGDGAHAIQAVADDAAGNASAPATVQVTVDTTPPAPPALVAPAPGALLGAAAAPAGLVAFRGTAEAGAEVTVVVDGVGHPASAAAGAFALDLPLADGTHDVVLVAVDPAGNGSPPALAAFSLDATPPPAPLVDPLPVTSAAPQLTVSGLAEPGALVEVAAGAAPLGSAVADAAGRFAIGLALPEGSATLQVRALDAAGNASPPAAAGTVLVDRTAPAAPVVTSPASGASLGAADLPGGALPVAGTAEPGSTVEVLVDGAVAALATADAGGAFAASAPAADGPHLVVVRARDAAGNASPDAPPVSVTVDTAAPAAPVLAPPPGPVSGTSVLLQGLAEPGATVTVLVEGAPAAVAVAAADGRFAVDLPLPGGDGTALIAAVARDAAGNASPASDAVAVTVDRTAPGAPSLTGAGGPTRAASLAVQGVAEPGATVSLRLDGVEVASVQALADGSFSADVPLPGADGAALVTAVALDAAGNAGPASQAIEVLVDRTAPGAPVLTWPAAGEHVQQGTVTLRGTAEPGATVTAWLAGLPVTSAAGPDGQFQLPIELAAGEYQLQLTATDAAGNVSPEAPAALTVLAGGGKPGSGCGCGTGAGGGPSAAALLALLALWPRRRRTAER